MKLIANIIWFIFGVIGVITVAVGFIRYLASPLLVFLYSVTGGAL